MSDPNTNNPMYSGTLFSNAPNLTTVHAQFQNSSQMSFEELFSGYNRLRVLTYSNSASIIEKATRIVDDVEIIFGREDIANQMSKYLQYQQLLIEDLKLQVKGSEYLKERIESGKLRLRVIKNNVSHEKLFLLAGDSSKRIITGSANFSEVAFSGNQNESFICFDNDDAAWDFFVGKYESIRTHSSVRISPKRVVAERFDAEDIPILSPEEYGDGSAQCIIVDDQLEVSNIRHKLLISRTPKQYEGLGQVINSNRGVARITRQVRKQTVQYIRSNSRTQKENPDEYLSIYHETGEIIFSGRRLILNVDTDDVGTDVAILSEYFEGYKKFRGDAEKLAKDYFTFMAWFYISPFICDFRSHAIANLDEDLNHLDYPVFGVLYGKSNCGKSELIKTLQLSMFQQEGFLPTEWFTKSQVQGLREQNRRFPLLFDDLDRKRFQDHAMPLIKSDYVDLQEYPAIILSMNADKDSFSTEIRKRALIIYTGASLPDHTGESRQLGARIKRLKRQLGNSLYREYLRRVLEATRQQTPKDILAFSSDILYALFEEHTNGDVPQWCHVTSMEEYTLTKYDKVKSDLLDLVENHPDAWSTNGNKILLKLGDVLYMRKLLQDIPDYLIRNRTGDMIVFYGDELEDFIERPVFPQKRSFNLNIFRQKK